MYQVIDGKKISQEIKDELKEKSSCHGKRGQKGCISCHSGRK